MLDRLSVRRLAILIAAIAIVLLAMGCLWVAGSAVVVDETSGVDTAFIVASDGREQPLNQLWNGFFYAIPQLEGTIQVRCHNGSRKEGGYVAGHMHTKIKIVGDAPCARLVEVI